MSLRSLGGDVPPPEHLKARVLRDLRARGLVRPPRAPWLRLAAGLAGLALFAAGYAVGRRAAAPVPLAAMSPRYALMLYEDEAFDRTPEPSLVTEYSAWARGLAAAGQLAGGEKLGLVVATEPAAGPRGPGELTGFFLITAPDDATAVALARGSPHRRHGGRVVVRRIDPT